jgi:CubicO group peptidase (beta-lactamase class C family)
MMMRRTITLFILLTVVLGLAASGRVTTLAATPSGQEPSLRLSDPIDEVVADLEDYIPERMREGDVPGLAIALIRDGEVVWTEGFGVANTITREPVRPETAFEVASNSKVVTAYTALRLVEEGKLSLDEPVSAYLSEAWLPPSEYADQITLRHLASHSSGLTDNILPVDKSIAFEPGSDFLYSGVGALYTQRVIEQVTGSSLEDAARQRVFEPLGMSSSSFVNNSALKSRMANGHINYSFPLFSFMVPYAVAFACLGLIGVLIGRLKTGKWRPTAKVVVGAAVLAAILVLLMVAVLMGRALPNLALLITLCAAAFAIAFILIYLIGRQIMARLPAAWQKGKRQHALHIAWIVLSLLVPLWLSGPLTGPMPKGPSPQASAIGSLRTSAPDLAAFLIELAEPEYLSQDLAAQIRTPQMSAGRDMSWGLGPGIQHGEQGDALWQNGQTFGYRSLMVIYPDHGTGVVVLTNSDNGFPVALDVARRTLGGPTPTSISAWLGS